MRIIFGYQDTRTNNEDLAITPYLFLLQPDTEIVKVIDLGICWLHYSFYIGIGKNIPRDMPTFINHNRK